MAVDAKPLLVVGATGRHGGTGRIVVERLRGAGIAVRALARVDDARAEALRKLGAEVGIGDLHDQRSLRPVLEGVDVAYFTYPVAAGIVDAAANFASAGRAAGLKRIVVMSMGAASPQSPSALARAQWLAEELFGWAGFSCLHLRIAAFFVENLELLHRADICGDGVLRNSFGDTPLSWMTGEDAGKIAVAALLHPERFGNQAAVYPSGGAPHTHAEVASLLGRYLRRTMRHETVSREVWRERLMAQGTRDNRISAEMADHISALGVAIRQPLPVNDLFERATGEKPVALPDAIEAGCLSFDR